MWLHAKLLRCEPRKQLGIPSYESSLRLGIFFKMKSIIRRDRARFPVND